VEEQKRFEKALNCVQDAERARTSLEMRLKTLEENLKASQRAIQTSGEERIATLESALDDEKKRRAELQGTSQDLNAKKANLEAQLREVMASREQLQRDMEQKEEAAKQDLQEKLEAAAGTQTSLQEQLAKAEEELKDAKAVGEITQDRAKELENELTQERIRAAHEGKKKEEAEKAKAALEQKMKEDANHREMDVGMQAKRSTMQTDRRVTSLEDALLAEQKKGAQLMGTNRDLEEQLNDSVATQKELQEALSKKEDELKKAAGFGAENKGKHLQTSAELAEERRKVAQEMSCVLEAERAKSVLEAKLKFMEQEFGKKETQLKTVEKNLKEKEAILGGGGALLSKLAAAEKGLRSREQALTNTSDQRTQTLQSELAEERSKRSELAGNYQDLHAARLSLEDKLSTASSRHGQLQSELHSAKNELRTTKGTAEDFRSFASEAEAALADERRRAEMARKECSELSETQSKAELAKTALEARLAEVEKRLKSGEAETLDFAQLLGGGGPQDLTKAAPVGGTQSEGGGTLSQSQSQTLSPAAAAPAAPMVASPNGSDGSMLLAAAPAYTAAAPAQTRGPWFGGENSAENWEPAASKLFQRLDRRGNGYVETSRVLQLWPLLSRHVEMGNAAAIAAQLLQSSAPMSLREWMSLMKALHTIVGPRRLRRNIRSAEAYCAELQSGSSPAATPPLPNTAAQGKGPGGIPLATASASQPSNVAGSLPQKQSFLSMPRAVPDMGR
jgi:chromosome segregation ATPase